MILPTSLPTDMPMLMLFGDDGFHSFENFTFLLEMTHWVRVVNDQREIVLT